MRQLLTVALAGAVLASGAAAQHIVSVKAGLIHYVEGDVKLDGNQVEIRKNGQFPRMQNESVLLTTEGRAELLMAPGVFLRVAENSLLRMVNDSLTDTRLELAEGAVLLEAAEVERGNKIAIRMGEGTVSIDRKGLYQLDAADGEVRVYDGRAAVVAGDREQTVRKGRLLALNDAAAVQRFDTKDGDALYRWAHRRAGYIAMANVPAARAVMRRGLSFSSGQWMWNPYFGMMTFLPFHSTVYSPFGNYFFSPRSVIAVYRPQPVFSPGMGSSGYGGRYDSSLGYSVTPGRAYGGFSRGGGMSGGAPTAAPAPSAGSAAASPRSSDSAVGRGSGGAGRGNR